MRHGTTGWLVTLLLLGCARESRADFISDTLGTAGPANYAILTLTGAEDIALNGPGVTLGNVGISSPGYLHLDSSYGHPSTAIQGNVFLGDAARMSHPSEVQGTIWTNQDARLAHANADARNASLSFAALTPTITAPGGAITGTTTIHGGAGLNVLNVSGIRLGNGQSLTLSGPAGAQFIINDSGALTLNSASIKFAGGLSAADVVLNATGDGPALRTSGGLHHESVINALLLTPNRDIAFAPGLVQGELIAGGRSIHLVSGASVHEAISSVPPSTSPAPAAPEPSSLALFSVGACALAALARFAGRRKMAVPHRRPPATSG